MTIVPIIAASVAASVAAQTAPKRVYDNSKPTKKAPVKKGK